MLLKKAHTVTRRIMTTKLDIIEQNKSKNLKQPKCLSAGCVLQPHQLDSLTWLATLYSNQINGILADDMVSESLSDI